jgi:hypothetical protein
MREQQAKLGARIETLETELAASKAAASAAPPPPATPATPTLGGSLFGRGAWGISAYVQAQYEQHQNSADQIGQGGVYLNQDRFLVRQGRLRLDAGWEYVELGLELDGNTTNGPAVSPKRINASVVWRGHPWEGRLEPHGIRDGDPPLLRLTGGLTGIPFGFELADSHRDRVFLERTQASQALFPGEQDVGAVLSGGVGFFRYSVAAMNGNPLGDGTALPVGDPNHAKDFVTRLGVDASPSERVRITGGVSALYGNGFHAGTQATKAGLIWVDQNQDGMVQANELEGVPPMAATPSANFTRWGVGVDLELYFHTPLGLSMLYGEVTAATNLDRGLFVADPVTTGVDVRELGAYVAFVQEIFRYGLLGFRFDYYDPNADFFQQSAGKLLPYSQAIKTFSPLVGLQLPDRARLVFEYDVVRNLLGINPLGVPTDLGMDHFAVRLQVQL